ncbi:MAG: ChaN family lipoprotein [Paracoccaceae bacterium]|nr:ChaN family lipoprotein [Paracoccaceae bacterium]
MRWIYRFCALVLATPLAAAEIGVAGLDALPAADVVILGEVHDNPVHHVNQARAVAALAPKAVVFEMLTADQAALVAPDLLRDPAGAEAALGWNAAGWPDFAMYLPIFLNAAPARIYGGAVPREAARGAFEKGAAGVFGDGAGDFGLDLALAAADQAGREAEQAAAHCGALPPDLLPGFVAAQRLRDAVLARAALQAINITGGPVVIITGNGHARRDQGIPAALALAAPGVRVVSVGQLEAEPGPDAPYDLWLITAPYPREDPCAAFAPPKP